MTRWQRNARLVIAIGAVIFAVVVALAFRKRVPEGAAPTVMRSDPKAVLESASGRTIRVNREHEEIRIDYEKLLSYSDGSSKMLGVKVVTERGGGRTFTITGKEGQVGEKESDVSVAGDVQITSTDGMVVRTERARYTEGDGMVKAPGEVQFSRGRMTGSGLGMTYNKTSDILTLLERVSVHMAPDATGAGALRVDAGTATFDRPSKTILFSNSVKGLRGGEAIESDAGAAHLTEDEQRLDLLELRGHSRVTRSGMEAGGFEAMQADDIDIRYATDGLTIHQAILKSHAVIQLAGEKGRLGRRTSGNAIIVRLAPDGAPEELTAQDDVRLSLPAEQGIPARTIAAQLMESKGEQGRGLTSAHFSGNVQFRESGQDGDRVARSGALDVAMSPGSGAIDEARFAQDVRFEQSDMRARAGQALYVIATDLLQMSSSGPKEAPPHLENDRISIDASALDITLTGPRVKASGAVKSVLRAAQKGRQKPDSSQDAKMPSMFKQDLPVNVTAEKLDYDSATSKAIYTDGAQLWQADTTLKGSSISLDDKSGDLAVESVVSRMMLVQEDEGKPKERVASTASAHDLKYEEKLRRATYSGEAHLVGSNGDLTAAKIEVFLNEAGDEAERVEAYDSVALVEPNRRKTTGVRLTYYGKDQRYLVTGAPVSIVDPCGRETTGRTLTFNRTTDRIVVDGNEQRTQTKAKSDCP